MMNVVRTGQKVIYKNLLTELNNPAGVKVKHEEVLDYAKSNGAEFVRLRFTGNVASETMGFQNGILTISKGRGGTELTWKGKTTTRGTPDRTGKLKFESDKLGMLWAYVPKFPHNMRVLAGSYINDSADWVIADEQDKKEIAELADKYAKELGWSREKTKKTTASSFRKLAEEIKQEIRPENPKVETPEPVKEVPVEDKRRPGRPKVTNDNHATGDIH